VRSLLARWRIVGEQVGGDGLRVGYRIARIPRGKGQRLVGNSETAGVSRFWANFREANKLRREATQLEVEQKRTARGKMDGRAGNVGEKSRILKVKRTVLPAREAPPTRSRRDPAQRLSSVNLLLSEAAGAAASVVALMVITV